MVSCPTQSKCGHVYVSKISVHVIGRCRGCLKRFSHKLYVYPIDEAQLEMEQWQIQRIRSLNQSGF